MTRINTPSDATGTMSLLDQEAQEAFDAYMEIDRTHAWLHRCFPPQPSKCTMCGVVKDEAYMRNPHRCRLGAFTGRMKCSEPNLSQLP